MKTFLTPAVFRAAAILSVEREKMALGDLGIGEGMLSMRDPDFIPTQMQIRGRDVVEHVVNSREEGRAAGKGPDAEAARELEVARMVRATGAQLDVNAVAGTSLIEVAYRAASPKESADMANAIADSFVAWSRDSRIEEAGEVSRFLESQIEQLKKDVQQKERKLADFGRSRDIVSIDPGTNVSMQKLEAFDKDYAAAVADRVNKEARLQQVLATSAETIAAQDPPSPRRAPSSRSWSANTPRSSPSGNPTSPR